METGSEYVDKAFAYQDRVIGKEQPACKWVRLACERNVSDLTRDDIYFDVDAAHKVCRFIENLPHTKGRWAAKHEDLKLEDWQCFVLSTIFGWRRQNGLRRFREAYIEVPRKNGKSQLAAGVGLYMMVADEEFGAEVYSGATSEKQAYEVFRPARIMAKRTPDLCDYYGVTVNASNLVRMEDNSRFEPLIGKPGDGSSPSCAIVDEFHEHPSPELYDTMMTGMGARDNPLMFIITTAGVDLSGPCYERRGTILKTLDGTFDNDDIFGIVYTIDEDDDWTDPTCLEKANPNFGVSVSDEFLRGRLKDACQNASRQNAFKTKHLNVWCGAKSAWMNMQRFAQAPAQEPLEAMKGRRVYLGLDLAAKIDLAVCTLLFPSDDGPWQLYARYYLPEEMVEGNVNSSHYDTWAKLGHIKLTPGNVIDFDAIADDIREDMAQYQVQEVAFDPWQATHLASQLLEEGVPMVEVRQTVANLSEPMKSLEAMIYSGEIAHGDNPVTTWCFSNCVAKLDNKDNIYPTKERPENKIDGVVASILAMARALISDDTESVYEYRELRSL